MKHGPSQQIVVSGVGGQGVLFLTRLLAEAAMDKGLPVFTSETHGMAQRGGTVISHLKVGDFTSPMIRPGCADGLLVLKEENLALHGGYGKSGAWVVVNSKGSALSRQDGCRLELAAVDASGLAQNAGSPRSGNLVVLGRALALCGNLFCSPEDILQVLEKRLGHDPQRLNKAAAALQAGMRIQS